MLAFLAGYTFFSGRHDNVLLLLAVWIGGLAIAVLCFRTPDTYVDIEGDVVVITDSWLVGERRSTVALGTLGPAVIVDGGSSDEGPRYSATVILPNGRTIAFAHDDNLAKISHRVETFRLDIERSKAEQAEVKVSS